MTWLYQKIKLTTCPIFIGCLQGGRTCYVRSYARIFPPCKCKQSWNIL